MRYPVLGHLSMCQLSRDYVKYHLRAGSVGVAETGGSGGGGGG